MKKVLATALSLLLCIVMISQAGALGVAGLREEIPAPDGEVYSNEVEYSTLAQLSAAAPKAAAQAAERISENPELQFVKAVVKEVYVEENLNPDNGVVFSRLMTRSEVEQLLDAPGQAAPFANIVVGGAADWRGKLTIALTVYENTSYVQSNRQDYKYSAHATADWDVSDDVEWTPPGEDYPDAGDDYFSYTWGGDGELQYNSANISGYYTYNMGDISFSKNKDQAYNGICWQFKDITGSFERYFAKSIDSSLRLRKTYAANQGKETDLRVTYIHTYKDLSRTISFDFSSYVPSVSINPINGSWTLEIDVPGLEY